MQKSVSYVDVHHHYNPLWESSLDDGIKQKIMKGKPCVHNITRTLEMMETCGIKKSIFSYPDSFLSLSENEHIAVCTRINEAYAELNARYPNLGAFARIPVTSNHDLALKEMEYALDVLHLEGILLPTCIFGLYPSSGLYLDIYKEMERRKGCIFFHPFVSEDKAECDGKRDYRLIQDITRATFELALNKFPLRYPDIRFIMSCGGGNISYLLTDNETDSETSSVPHWKQMLPQGIEKYFKRIYYDTCSLVQTGFAKRLGVFSDRTRILYGSNFPYSTLETIRKELEELRMYSYDDQRHMDEICRENASFFMADSCME